jgi:hypothetical protein
MRLAAGKLSFGMLRMEEGIEAHVDLTFAPG